MSQVFVLKGVPVAVTPDSPGPYSYTDADPTGCSACVFNGTQCPSVWEEVEKIGVDCADGKHHYTDPALATQI